MPYERHISDSLQYTKHTVERSQWENERRMWEDRAKEWQLKEEEIKKKEEETETIREMETMLLKEQVVFIFSSLLKIELVISLR